MKKIIYTIAVFLFSVSNLFSYPRFSAYTGSKCSDCHINPTGGTMRNQYGLKYAKDNLYIEALKNISDKNDFSGELTKNIFIGGDVRTVFIDNENHNLPNFNSFFTMQGDLYLNAKINKHLNIFISPGINLPDHETKYEVYGMISNLPLNSYFKAGRLTPNFGIKIAEHRAFQRQDLMNAPYSPDNGFEIGISPGIFNFNMGLFNGLFSGSHDNDQNKMFVASGDFSLTTKDENLSFNFGGSLYNNPYNYYDPNLPHPISANRKAWGGFTKIGIYNTIAVLGEYDFSESDITSLVRSVYRYVEFNARIFKGIEVRGVYEFKDVNRDIIDDEITRYSFGAALYPMLGFETEAAIRFIKYSGINAKEFQWSFHFYF